MTISHPYQWITLSQKLNREITNLMEVMIQMDRTDIYRTFHSNTKEHSFFPACHGTFFKICHIISHKTNLNRIKKIEITPCILSDHHGLKLNFNNRNNRKPTYSWKLNNSLLKMITGSGKK